MGEPSERSLEKTALRVDDAELAAAHAANFMLQRIRNLGPRLSLGESVPSVKICAPVACEVVASEDAALLGVSCTLTPYPFTEVRKYVFEGTEPFHDLTQSFFHYAAFASGSDEFVCDLQGNEDRISGNVYLIDPVVLRVPKGPVLSA